MDLTTILLIVIAAGLAVAIFLLLRKKTEPEKKDDGSLLMLQQQIVQIAQAVDSKLSESNKNVQEQFKHSSNLVQNVTEQLVKLGETNKQVLNFSGQLQKLQETLQNPKHRGVLGEYFLDSLLKDVFQPNQYQMQYKFKNGEIVDAVIFLGEKIIPIDSKFSLENYNRMAEEQDPSRRESLENEFKNDLKKRIDETAKYIRPKENTMDFAFMFIPAEGIYYDLLVNKVGAVKVNTRSLLEYAAREKKVHIVSPTTFYVTLQAVWQGMRAFTIQEGTKEILKNVGMLQKHIRAYEDYMRRIGNNLSTTVNSYNTAYKELGKIDKDVVKLTGGDLKIEIEQIDRPELDGE
ncbi:MAG: DNA recombination protein RmuC [bacterium]